MLVAVDGSVFHVLARIARLAWITNWSDRPTSGYRRQPHFEILRRLPKQIEATSANPNGEDAEQAVFEQTVEPVRCDVIDRGDQKYASWNKIHVIGSNDVCRVRDRFAYETMEQRELSLEASNADVLTQIIRLGHQTAKLDHTIRLICVRCSPLASRGCRCGRNDSSTGPRSDGSLRIVTDMLDLPAEVIAELSHLRWTIELFFRMVKQPLGCRQ